MAMGPLTAGLSHVGTKDKPVCPVGPNERTRLSHNYEVANKFNSVPPSASQTPIWLAIPGPTLKIINFPL